MIRNIIIICIISGLSFLGCKGTEGFSSEASSSQSDGNDNAIVDGQEITPVMLLKNMNDLELEEVSELCPRESGRDWCVVICHVPPGNPAAAKTLLIPHQAFEAHVRHGSAKHNHHDFVGNCDQLPELDARHPGCKNGKKKKGCSINDDEGSDNDDEEGHQDDDSEGEIEDPGPYYCEPIFNSDLDCDGYDDETGAPLL